MEYLTGKVGFEKGDISRLGPRLEYLHSLEDTTYPVSFREKICLNY
jgi:hypothetical protein